MAGVGAREGAGKNLMEYKGYVGSVEFDNDAGIFHGEIINMRDVVTFRGTSVEELRQALVDSVEDYLEFCAQRGENPDKPFSGKFLVRVEPELHRKVYLHARLSKTSINQVVKDALKRELN